jgi:hypothetical protein
MIDIKLAAEAPILRGSGMTSGHSKVFCAVVQSLLDEGLSVRFRASGRSMLPAVRDGECLIVAPARAGEVAVGDVVLCDTWRGPVAHRISSVERLADGERRFTLRGDASLEGDGPVVARQIRGKIASVERDGLRLSLALRGGQLGLAAMRSMRSMRSSTRSWLATLGLSTATASRT